ncbi:Ger(x)C family spore germination protein [Paenibacillus sp. PAMC21692]|uniref:Ger(x)C family spore germination protein n=1 Tax=Paenibacillus sp. PAMC21692 TaxID=2762320 RepID=UPI00164E97CE|nr:Ger(x)C family spore germination protein [Paenibacillus sp. PAMC21692]QNK56769.1 Ger(x)C family spore germination protein [Paenibacillus sp. PAMC21692]
MKTNRKRLRVVPVWIVVSAFLLSGCNQQLIVDRITMINILGIDERGRQIVGNAIYSDYDRKEKLKFTQGIGQTTQLVFGEMQMHETKPLRLGKLRMLLFSKSLAEKGVIRYIHSICRDPLINSYLIVAVSEQSTEVLLKQLGKQRSDKLPNRIIEQNEKAGNVPATNLHTFMFNYYGDGRDVFVPYIGLSGDGVIEVKGMALFQEDKLALVLDKLDTVAFKLLQPKFEKGFLTVRFDDSEEDFPAVLNLVSGGSEMKMTRSDSGIGITFHTKIYGFLKDQEERVDIREQKDFEHIEQAVEKEVNRKLLVLLKKLQERGIDPLGIGDFVRARDKAWKEDEFYAHVYPKVKLNVVSEVMLKESSIGN